MAPTKKREKDANGHNGAPSNTNSMTNSSSNNGASANNNSNGATATEQCKLNGHQQEQELFLQAFEKPTQIYRFLRNRHCTSPIFLYRTLTYMKDRMSRTHKRRQVFKVNSVLDTLIEQSESVSNNFLSIIFNGVFDKTTQCNQWWNAGDVVTVDSTLFKITKNKRKDSTSDFQEILSHTTNVVYNPHEELGQFSAISIPVQSMQPLGDQHTIYKLQFRIKVTSMALNGSELDVKEEMPSKHSKTCNKIYGCELVVFEKNAGLIPEGDYDANLQEVSSTTGLKSFSPKKRNWETFPHNYIPLSMKFNVFRENPTLKFRLTWSTTSLPPSIEAKDFSKYGGFSEAAINGLSNGDGTSQINHNNNCVKITMTLKRVKREKIQIVYNFLYSNNTRQQTEYTQEVICPWCGLDCLRLYALLKHLNLCHARFNFTYQPAENGGARIDVTINDAYDGSYAGSPYDQAHSSGNTFPRICGPVRRTVVTNWMVCRPRRQKTCLDEFLVLDEDDLSNQRPYITGHNRLYHHTETCLPVHPKELDIDSEGESDPLWLRQKTIQMIDEFTDVNEGEKELMKLWNLHVMKHGYVGDCQLPLACEMFLDAKGAEIIHKNLYRNFILHMCSLFDYGLVSPEIVYKVVQKLQGMLSKNPDGQILMSKQREAQLKYWLEVGMHKEDEQKLKSPQKTSPNNNISSNGANAVVAAAATSIKSVVAADAKGTAITASPSGNKNTAAATAAVTAAAAADAKVMHPPMKRSATAVKRASMHPQNGQHNGADKGSSTSGCSGNGGGSSKSVAKKTVNQEMSDATGSTSSGRTKRLSADRSSEGRQSLDGNRAVKRKLLSKDATTSQPPASKRSRSDSYQANLSTTTHATTAAASATTTTILTATLPKRLITRRQSIAGDFHTTSSTSLATNTRSSTSKNTAAAAAYHALRTRLSVPLTKVDKR